MTNFRLTPQRYEDVVPFLKARMPAFVRSNAYDHENDDLTGVVLAAFGRFLTDAASWDPGADTVKEGLALIEELLGWNDTEVTTSIREEFCESADPAVLRTAAGPALRQQLV